MITLDDFQQLKDAMEKTEHEWQLRDNELAYDDGWYACFNAMNRAYLKLTRVTPKDEGKSV